MRSRIRRGVQQSLCSRSTARESGLLSPEELETSSIIAPSPKISLAVVMLCVAFDPLFALAFVLVFKATSLCTAAVHDTHSPATVPKLGVLSNQKRNLDSTPVPAHRGAHLAINGKRPDRFGRALGTPLIVTIAYTNEGRKRNICSTILRVLAPLQSVWLS